MGCSNDIICGKGGGTSNVSLHTDGHRFFFLRTTGTRPFKNAFARILYGFCLSLINGCRLSFVMSFSYFEPLSKRPAFKTLNRPAGVRMTGGERLDSSLGVRR